jgi:hypothetical protein
VVERCSLSQRWWRDAAVSRAHAWQGLGEREASNWWATRGVRGLMVGHGGDVGRVD